MDEFNDELFENDNSAIPLEKNGEPEKSTDIYSSQETADEQPEAEKPSEVFQFEENGEYHFTSAPSDTEIKEEPAHTENNSYPRQNPYRSAYQQNSGASNPYSSGASYTNQSYSQRSDYGYQSPETPSKGSGKGKKIVAAIIMVILILGSVGIGISIGKSKNTSKPSVTDAVRTTGDSATLETEAPSNQSVTSDSSASPGIAVAKKARGSVVGVSVYDVNGTLYGEGSGVVMGLSDSKNTTYIITCAHVISDKNIKSCGILLRDGTICQAKIVGFDERTDIGVLSISQTNLEAATFGDSTALQVGEAVYAIGNPGGSEYYGSMTSGIVSALDRSISSTYNMTVIQHNAAISPGNSGGALVNSSGQVIGINSSKISATDYEGIGFAVPISVARPVVEDLIKYGYVPNRPKLGISYAPVSNYWRYSAIVQSKGLPTGSVIIAAISDDSSFKGTEVTVGDMITSVNGKKLDKSDILLDVIDKSGVGDSIELGICRIERSSGVGGSYKVKQFDVTVKLVEDKGSSSTDTQEETTTQSFYEYYYGDGNGNENYRDFEDFFSNFNDFFGNGN